MALLLVAALLAGGFVFFLVEYFVKGDDWVIFAGSPHVYNGGNIGCGIVVDRDNTVLLNMNEGRTYTQSIPLRQATVHWLGDRYGSISAPALPHYAAELAGFDAINGVYSYGQVGGIAELTLSGAVQTAALEAMGDYKGTVAVYNYKTGELLCAVTTPTYDPNDVPQFTEGDEKYEGLYVNRFTQSSYIPGSIFKIVTLAAALEEDPEIVNQRFSCNGSYKVGSEEIICEDAHWDQSLKEAFRNSCNCAFAQIGLQLGAETLQKYVDKFGIVESVSFDGITTQSGNFQVIGEADLNVGWSSIGQYLDLVNPCAFLTFMGAIANDGKTIDPYLVDRISVNGITTYDAKRTGGERILSEETTKILQEYLVNNVENKYGADNFPGYTVGAKTGTGEVDGGKKPNAMLAGFADSEDLPLAFIVCVEDAGYGRAVCVPIISKVLSAIRENIK